MEQTICIACCRASRDIGLCHPKNMVKYRDTENYVKMLKTKTGYCKNTNITDN